MRSFLRFFGKQCLRLFPIFAGVFLSQLASAKDPAAKPIPGLSVSFKTSSAADVATSQNVWLYIPAGKSPTPFLPGEKFTAIWEGFLSVDLRGDYAFQAEMNGNFKLEINGTNVIETAGANSISDLSKAIRLAKGTNALKATFTSPAQGDAFVRLNWKPRDSFAQPIPSASLSHLQTAEEQTGNKLRLGRELFVEHQCAKCHAVPPSKSAMPELAMDAPSFEEIGARRNFDWMARWIADPKGLRASAHMPAMFSDESAQTKSREIAAFLASLKSASPGSPAKEPSPEKSEAGHALFETLHCTACHNAPDSPENDLKKISLKNVREKFAPGTLVDFLKQPDSHYAWIRMPNFKLSDEQREQLAAYLLANGETPREIVAPTEKEIIENGKKLVQTSGCLNCHSLKLENRFSTKTLAEIADWKSGCLAGKEADKSKAPQFGFSAEKREALEAFVETDRASLNRHVPSEFAERQSRILNCAECHTRIEGVPRFELLGGKLNPEWSAKFIGGNVSYKPRPWIESQMPAFPKHAQLLAEGLAMQHGLPGQLSIQPPIENELTKTGENLVSVPPLGFSCVSCHAVGSVGATQVFEAPGINLAYSGERLQPGFFKRWLLNPALINPITKMPVYFDEQGKSPLTDVFDGDGEKQIHAMWEYIRLGEKMPAPRTE